MNKSDIDGVKAILLVAFACGAGVAVFLLPIFGVLRMVGAL